jgi:hypothetical protein
MKKEHEEINKLVLKIYPPLTYHLFLRSDIEELYPLFVKEKFPGFHFWCDKLEVSVSKSEIEEWEEKGLFHSFPEKGIKYYYPWQAHCVALLKDMEFYGTFSYLVEKRISRIEEIYKVITELCRSFVISPETYRKAFKKALTKEKKLERNFEEVLMDLHRKSIEEKTKDIIEKYNLKEVDKIEDWREFLYKEYRWLKYFHKPPYNKLARMVFRIIAEYLPHFIYYQYKTPKKVGMDFDYYNEYGTIIIGVERTKITQESRKEFFEVLKERQEILKSFGVKLLKKRDEYGLHTGYKEISDKISFRVKELRDEGKTYDEIADILTEEFREELPQIGEKRYKDNFVFTDRSARYYSSKSKKTLPQK